MFGSIHSGPQTNIRDGPLQRAQTTAIHTAAGGREFESRTSIGSTFWRSAGIAALPHVYEAVVPPGLHLACGIARIQTYAEGVGGFVADGPAINGMICLASTAFRTEMSAGQSLACGLWLTPDQTSGASGGLAELSEAMGHKPLLRCSTTIPARIVARHCAPIDPWFQGAARDLATEARALELIAAVLTWVMQGAVQNQPAAPRRQVLAARNLIETRLLNPMTLGEIARAVGLNERSLTTGFRQAFGASIATYVTARRLDLAADFLSDGTSPSETARQVGYRPTHLAVAFKRRFGVSPSVYRRQ